jgi:GPH family glycoside/pentoside/hexuronide:cation symporter
MLVFGVKVFDGIIDIPLSTFTDNLRRRWGRRRPAILLGYIPLLIAYVLFLFPLENQAGIVNTLWFAGLLAVFYGSYTLTMVTYYATFAEVLKDEKDRVFVSNVKSVCDVVYMSISFALVPVFVSMGVNIRVVALIFLPLAVTMLIPLFLIKENATNKGAVPRYPVVQDNADRVSFITSMAVACKNKKFLLWLLVVSVMNIGLQLFLGGINEFFSSTGLNMTLVMASAFAPVPFTLMLYNKLVKKFGLKTAFQSILVIFSVGMTLMFVCRMLPLSVMTPLAMLCGIIVSFAIGAFFSVTYTVPAHLAAEENKKSGICASSMYFAVQGLFEGVAAGFAIGIVLVFLKQNKLISIMTILVALFCMIAFVLAFFLPKSIGKLGKEGSEA